MLVLSRKVNENIVIDGRIIVKVVRTEGNFVKLGIEAPPEVQVHRQEIYDEIQRNNQAALLAGRPIPPRLPRAAGGVVRGQKPEDRGQSAPPGNPAAIPGPAANPPDQPPDTQR